MEVKKIPTMYETKYIAIDSKEWDTEQQCQQYEFLLQNINPLKKLLFFNSKGEPIDIFSLKEIPPFSYLLIKEDGVCYNSRVIQAVIGANERCDASYILPSEKGLWHNDWTNAFNGGYRINGWVRCESIESLERKIKECQRKITFYQQLLEG